MKVKFDIKFRPQIESGEYKVETFSGYPVTIYRWDFDDGAQTPIMGSYIFEDGKEYVGAWNEEGHFDLMSPNDLDLFIITPEPELSEFEEAVGSEIFDPPFNEEQIKVIKEESVKLLAIARNEIVKSGYAIIEGEHYLEEGRKNYERGKEEALNDLPRWKKADRDLDAGTIDFAVFHKNDGGDHEDWLSVEVTNRLYKGEYYIELSDLEKLPKED